ncbi:MAG: aldo/keto reductase [Alphaproteobacteria bacterium]|nr:MAG: aldo/keto reductase [Alphaproteobacteria bacterium]
MKHIALGQTGLKISPLGLGTVKFGRNQGVKYPQDFDLPDDERLLNLLNLAKSLGINMLDTAPAYGTSEERLGTLLAGQREDWVIIGKAGEEFEDGKSSYNFTPDHFERSLERSLKRLNTDYIDALLIHSDGADMEILNNDALIKKMHDFKDQGLVKAIGASTKTAQGGIKTLELMDLCMATYTPDYTDEKPVLDYAQKHNKGVILKKVLSSGHNTNIKDALRFAFDHKGTSGVIIGTITPKHLEQNIKVMNNILNH